jgi:FkbM family methyltransferase
MAVKHMAELSLLERALLFYGTRLPNHPRKWWLHDRLRRLLGVSVEREIEVVRDGMRWLLNPADYEHEGLFWTGAKDRWDLFHLRQLVPPGGVFFDIGANIGYYSLTLANGLQKRCQVHAFEPTPATYERLRRHIEWNGMAQAIEAHQLALSDTSGTANLIQRADNSGASRLGVDAQGVAVPVTTLDRFCDERGINRLDAIKIDVEGYEARVLRGGQSTISRLKPALIVEFWTTGLARADATVDELADLLRSFGYKLYKPVRDRLIPITVPPCTDIPENVFCFHNDRPLGTVEADKAQ